MALTVVTITGTFEVPSGGDPINVKLTAWLNKAFQNGTKVIEPEPIVGVANSSGQLVADDGESPFTLVANDDAASTPPGSFYSFLIEVDNAPVRSFNAVVGHATSPIDLTALAPIEP